MRNKMVMKQLSFLMLMGFARYTLADMPTIAVNNMGDGSNLFFGPAPLGQTGGGLLVYSNAWGEGLGGALGVDSSMQSSFGSNYILPFRSLTDLSSLQYSLPSDEYMIGQPSAKTKIKVSPQVSVTEIAPANPNTDPETPPIYHITVSGEEFNQPKQNSTYVTPYNIGYMLNGQAIYDYILSPLSMSENVSGSTQTVTLGSTDFYFDQSASNLGLVQNLDPLAVANQDKGSSIYQNIDLSGVSYKGSPLPEGCAVPVTLTTRAINQTPDGHPWPVAANGMDQTGVQVSIALNLPDPDNPGQCKTRNISADDPNYGWMYQDIYFINTADNTIVDNTYTPGNGIAMNQAPGPYPYGINSYNLNVKYLGVTPITVGDIKAGTYYFSATEPMSDVAIIPAITYELNTSDDIVTAYGDSSNVANQFSAQTVNFGATTWSEGKNTLSFNSALTIPSASQEAVYLNLNNPDIPFYEGFSSYEIGMNGCSDGSTIVSNNPEGTLFCAALASQTSAVSANAIDTYGDYYATGQFGNGSN